MLHVTVFTFFIIFCSIPLVVEISALLPVSVRATTCTRPSIAYYRQSQGFERIELYSSKSDDQQSFLLSEFRTASGEVINPYEILKVPRESSKVQIRKSYIDLSRRYHPDGVRHRTILPGSCNNLDEVRDQWERIKLSYEILSNKQTRLKYDRHEALADPGAAMKRAAVNAAFKGVKNVGKGLFDFGAFAVSSVMNKNDITDTRVKEVE